jgi:hypothetical protein
MAVPAIPPNRNSKEGSRVRRPMFIVAALCVLLVAGAASPRISAAQAMQCDRTVTTSTFASELAAATDGETICLATGDYGTWTGTSKNVTITADAAASPVMKLDLDSADGNFTLDGIGGLGGSSQRAHDYTIRNSTFTSPLNLRANQDNVLLESNEHDWNAVYDGTINAKIFLWEDGGGTSGVTIRDSTFRNGDLDGIHLNVGATIQDNTFQHRCDVGTNHTDAIQTEGMAGGRDHWQPRPGAGRQRQHVL